MKDALLYIKDLKVNYKVFDGELKVINNLNLYVNRGEKVGLVGETGCGKTTTMKTILKILPSAGLVKNGEIWYQGKDLLKLSEKEMINVRRKDISVIFENPIAALNPVFTIGKQLYDAIKYSQKIKNNKMKKEEIKKKSINVLKSVSLPDAERLLKNYPVQLSGGMRQRICIALALVTASNLIIADEPGTNLDVTVQDQILRLLNNLSEEHNNALIYITHTLGVVRQFMDRVYVMYAGDTIEVAKTEDLFNKPSHPYTKGLLGAVPKLTGEEMSEGVPGRVPDYLSPPKGCRFYPRCEFRMDICKEEKPDFKNLGNGHQVRCFKEGV